MTFRTIDVGIDQKSWDGVNMNLGVRGLRFCLENTDVFKKQLRSLYRASVFGPMRILLPFVSSVDDLDSAHEIIADDASESSRKSAMFWLSREAAAAAVAGLGDIAQDDDAASTVRADAVFYLAQRKDGAGIEPLIRIVRQSKSVKIRKDAIWLISAGMQAQENWSTHQERVRRDPLRCRSRDRARK